MKTLEVTAKFKFQVPDEVEAKDAFLIVIPGQAKLIDVMGKELASMHESQNVEKKEIIDNGK